MMISLYCCLAPFAESVRSQKMLRCGFDMSFGRGLCEALARCSTTVVGNWLDGNVDCSNVVALAENLLNF